jgi:enamine deaminase RidA (YjgF/YER057c/UK114 family)
MDDVCCLTNYLTITLREKEPAYQGIAAIRREYFREPSPASTLVEVRNLMIPGALVEVEATAVLNQSTGGR